MFRGKNLYLFFRKHSLIYNIHERLRKLCRFARKFASSLLSIAYFISERAQFAIYYSRMKNSLSQIKREEIEVWNWVPIVHAFPTEKLLKERQRRLLVSTDEKGSQIVKFLPDMIHLGVSIKWSIGSHGTYQPLKISHLRKSHTSVFPLPSGASRTYSSLIDSLVDLLLPSTYLIAAIEAESFYFACRLE